jgi:hypothetical protein
MCYPPDALLSDIATNKHDWLYRPVMNLFLRRSFWRRECALAHEEANGKAERAVPETVLGVARRRLDVTCVGCATWS